MRLGFCAAGVLAGIFLASAGVWILAAVPDVARLHPGGADYKLVGLLVWLAPGLGCLWLAFLTFRLVARQVVVLWIGDDKD
jgi:hypothetical protein